MMYSYSYYLFKANNYNLTCTRYGIVRPLSLKFDIISSLGLLFLSMLHAAFKSAFITCAGHGINLASESLVKGIYHQV